MQEKGKQLSLSTLFGTLKKIRRSTAPLNEPGWAARGSTIFAALKSKAETAASGDQYSAKRRMRTLDCHFGALMGAACAAPGGAAERFAPSSLNPKKRRCKAETTLHLL